MMHPHKIDSYYAVKLLVYTNNEKKPTCILNNTLFPTQNPAWETYSFIGNAQDVFPEITAIQILPENSADTIDSSKYPTLFIAQDKDHAPALGFTDILFERTTGKLIDGQTNQYDKTRACLTRLYDFARYGYAEPMSEIQAPAPQKVTAHEAPFIGPCALYTRTYFEYTGYTEHT